jgi:hypothetical protein
MKLKMSINLYAESCPLCEIVKITERDKEEAMTPKWARDAEKLSRGKREPSDSEAEYLEDIPVDPQGAAAILRQHRNEWKDIYLDIYLLRIFKRAEDWDGCIEAVNMYLEEEKDLEKRANLLKKRANFCRKAGNADQAALDEEESNRLLSLYRTSIRSDPKRSDLEKALCLPPDQADKAIKRIWEY